MKKVIVFCIIFTGLAFKGYATETETTDAKSGYNIVIETILQDKTTDELEKIGLFQDKESTIGPETTQAVINKHLTCIDEKRSGKKRCSPELLWLYSELLSVSNYITEKEAFPFFTNNRELACRLLGKIFERVDYNNATRIINVIKNSDDTFKCLTPYLIKYYKQDNRKEALEIIDQFSPGWFREDSDYIGVLHAADEFKKIVEEKDLNKLILITDLDNEQITNINKIFDDYSNIDFERNDIRKWIWSMDSNDVSLRFYKYKDKDEKKVLLNPEEEFKGSIDLLDLLEYSDDIYLEFTREPKTGRWHVATGDLGYGEMSFFGKIIYSGIMLWLAALLILHIVPLTILIIITIRNRLMATGIKWVLIIIGLVSPIICLIIYLIYNSSLQKRDNHGGDIAVISANLAEQVPTGKIAKPSAVRWAWIYDLVACLQQFFVILAVFALSIIPTYINSSASGAPVPIISSVAMLCILLLLTAFFLIPVIFIPKRKTWVHTYQSAALILGLLGCFTIIPAIILLIYWFKPDVKAYFNKN